MMTPQQIQEICFEKAVFGGYSMQSVDDILEPLTEDYIALYKENSVLKSKMRILVEKLEEYRKQEASMQTAIVAAQKTCDRMIAEAEERCRVLLHEAEEIAAAKAQNVDAQLGSEQERLELAQQATARFIDGMERRLRRQLELLEELRAQELPAQQPADAPVESDAPFDYEKAPIPPTTEEKADALIEEIGQRIDETLQAGSQSASDEPAEPTRKIPTIRRFEDLKFGKNYHPEEQDD